jgi:hypothetical protein
MLGDFMNDTDCIRLSYVFALFPSRHGASEAYTELKPFVLAAGLEVEAVVIAQRAHTGKVQLHEHGDIRTSQIGHQNRADCSELIRHMADSLLLVREVPANQGEADLQRLGQALTDHTSALLAVVGVEMATAILDHLVLCGAAITTGPLATTIPKTRTADFWALVD